MTLADAAPGPTIQVGILTKGRPMLATVVATLVLQEEHPIEIFIVDTGEQPSIKREDVKSVLRLAQDRRVRCEYELHRDRQRAFSSGRLKLLESLTGPLIAFMDDDIVLAGMAAMASLARRAEQLGPRLGWVAPLCVNAGSARGFLRDRPHYSPGGILAQDDVVRGIMLEYYNNNTDVLDARGPRERVWELEFLTELFPALGRVTEVQNDTVSYHLDYGGGTRWDLMEEALAATTRRELHRLVAKYAPAAATG
ncbi:MAG: glycosyltransferase family 2 protein [Chloroflexi bacterium]|nr:glycosyltransferase family 2 protein [Chloroflexota bacterium]MBV9601511.1 glycosyltransferase family 2 protein [Chloroflexota bacterium]